MGMINVEVHKRCTEMYARLGTRQMNFRCGPRYLVAGQLDYTLHQLIGLVVDAINTPCKYCKVNLTVQNVSPDHIKPRCRGGSDTLDNLEIVCKTCNMEKGYKKPWTFMKTEPYKRRIQAGREE